MDPLFDSSETETDEDLHQIHVGRIRGEVQRNLSPPSCSPNLEAARRDMRQEFKLVLKQGVPYKPNKEVLKLKRRLRHLSQGKLQLHLHMKEQDSEVIHNIIQTIKLEFGDKISDAYL